jgi:hypothetical protein
MNGSYHVCTTICRKVECPQTLPLVFFLNYIPNGCIKMKLLKSLDKVKTPEYHEAMVNVKIVTFRCFMRNQYLNSIVIRFTNGPDPPTLPLVDKKSVASSVAKSSQNANSSNMWCHYFDKNNQNTADCREIDKFK